MKQHRPPCVRGRPRRRPPNSGAHRPDHRWVYRYVPRPRLTTLTRHRTDEHRPRPGRGSSLGTRAAGPRSSVPSRRRSAPARRPRQHHRPVVLRRARRPGGLAGPACSDPSTGQADRGAPPEATAETRQGFEAGARARGGHRPRRRSRARRPAPPPRQTLLPSSVSPARADARARNLAAVRTSSPTPPLRSRRPCVLPPSVRRYHGAGDGGQEDCPLGRAVRDDCLVDALTAERSPVRGGRRARDGRAPGRALRRRTGAAAPPAGRRGRRRRSDQVEADRPPHPDPGLRRVAEPGRRRGSPGRPTVPRSPPGTRRRGGASGAAGPGARVAENDPVARSPGAGRPRRRSTGPGGFVPTATRGWRGRRRGKRAGCPWRHSWARGFGAGVPKSGGGDSDGTCWPGAPRVAPSKRTGASPGAAGPPTDPGRGPPVVQHRGSGGPAA